MKCTYLSYFNFIKYWCKY